MRNASENCGWEVRWLLLSVGAVLALAGGIVTTSIVGAIVGIPLLLLAWPLLKTPIVPAACS